MMWDEIKNILSQIEPILLIIIPTIFAIYLKIRDKCLQKKQEHDKENIAKNKEKFSVWKHIESMNVIENIKTICNYYKDIGHASLVNYIQLENGTIATSKLCNMFLSCLAEDTRFGSIPKMMPNIQRIPYTRMSSWVNDVRKDNIHKIPTMKDFKEDYSFVTGDPYIKSCMSIAVSNGNGIFIGMCTFFFDEENYCGMTDAECEELLEKFKTSIETVFINYNKNRLDKLKSLNLTNLE